MSLFLHPFGKRVEKRHSVLSASKQWIFNLDSRPQRVGIIAPDEQIGRPRRFDGLSQVVGFELQQRPQDSEGVRPLGDILMRLSVGVGCRPGFDHCACDAVEFSRVGHVLAGLDSSACKWRFLPTHIIAS